MNPFDAPHYGNWYVYDQSNYPGERYSLQILHEDEGGVRLVIDNSNLRESQIVVAYFHLTAEEAGHLGTLLQRLSREEARHG